MLGCWDAEMLGHDAECVSVIGRSQVARCGGALPTAKNCVAVSGDECWVCTVGRHWLTRRHPPPSQHTPHCGQFSGMSPEILCLYFYTSRLDCWDGIRYLFCHVLLHAICRYWL